MTGTEALEKIRNYILNGDHSDGIIAPILNWCDEALESPKTREAREIRAMNLQTPMAKMIQEALASDLECESMAYERKCANYKKALKDIIHLEKEMNESINKAGYATGGEAGHYFYRAVKVAKEALK